MQIDLSDFDVLGDRKKIPEGTHEFEVTKADAIEGKLVVEFVLDEEHWPANVRFTLGNKTGMAMLKSLAMSAGVIGDDGVLDPESLVGKRVKAKASHREWEGKTYVNLGSFARADGSGVVPF